MFWSARQNKGRQPHPRRADSAEALRIAIDRGDCDVFLMPLGGGVFCNAFSDIKAAIAYAYQGLKAEIEEANVFVKVLAWEMNPAEATAFE